MIWSMKYLQHKSFWWILSFLSHLLEAPGTKKVKKLISDLMLTVIPLPVNPQPKKMKAKEQT